MECEFVSHFPRDLTLLVFDYVPGFKGLESNLRWCHACLSFRHRAQPLSARESVLVLEKLGSLCGAPFQEASAMIQSLVRWHCPRQDQSCVEVCYEHVPKSFRLILYRCV
jgi:hypothetical protein